MRASSGIPDLKDVLVVEDLVFDKADAERLAAFIRTLVFEQPKQITQRKADEDIEQ